MSTSFLTRRVLGSIVRPVIVLGVLLLTAAQAPGQQAFVTLNGNLKTEAWWVIAEFQPFTTEVRGIPANQIRKSWCKATEFRKDLIPKELMFENGTDAMKGAGMSFTIEGRFDGGATKQIAVVGVFQECAGPKGRFMLLLDQADGEKPKIRFVDAIRTNRQFAALSKDKGGKLVLWGCMECDGYSVLKWDRTKNRFGWGPQAEEP
ncbi:hypothetical protein [Bradyrhizobium sp. CCBAU 65884]|uniref:hypothetical protein n=1 Tax=Bradyrhizobium sp. CCBAU 65884 TaxID=722477 RepID=UPI00230634DC|nr:hypothetical protein [Bradyrhizobium sp. CCBAU 65884]